MDINAAASCAHEVWSYNRENYKSDREMRQEQEFTIMEFRIKQAQLWREDVRDLIALTQRKMSSYHIICALSLQFCITMFTEGRLPPGTPRWLLRFEMLSLSAAFLYLLMAMWLAMHASVFAQSVQTRLLTQLVRLPIPSWEQLEACRTYGASFETLPARQMLRIPFLQTMREDLRDREYLGGGRGHEGQGKHKAHHDAQPVKAKGSAAAATAKATTKGRHSSSSSSSGDGFVDPWRLERDASGDIYELQQLPPGELRHTKLVRSASAYFQSYDAFARVCLAFGMNQLLHALEYFAFGYLLLQNGAPFAGISMTVIAVSTSIALVELDWSLSQDEKKGMLVLATLAPLCTGVAALEAAARKADEIWITFVVLPLAFLAHAAWFVWALDAAGIQRQPNGSVLPMKFRAVLYLDVFGWFYREDNDSAAGAVTETQCQEKLEALKEELKLWSSQHVQQSCSSKERERIETCRQEVEEMETELIELVGKLPYRPHHDEHSYWVELTHPNGQKYFMDPVHGATREGARRQIKGFLAWQPILSIEDTEKHVHELYTILLEIVESSPVEVAEATAQSTQAAPQGGSQRPQEGPAPASASEEERTAGSTKRRVAFETDADAAGRAQSKLANYLRTAGTIKGIGDEAVFAADVSSFDPVSFYPYGRVGAREDVVAGGEEIVTGHDHWKPGKVPEKFFRGMTIMMAVLWTVALLLSFDIAFGTVSFHTAKLPEAVAASIRNGESERTDQLLEEEPYGTEGADTGNIDTGRRVYSRMLPNVQPLDGATQVPIELPSGLPFWPRALGCDAQAGGLLAMADDVNVIAGRLPAQAVENENHGAPEAVPLHLQQYSSCGELEGQGLKDIAITCSGSSSKSNSIPPTEIQECHLLVLIAHGAKVATCQLLLHEEEDQVKRANASASGGGAVWRLSQRWLDKGQEEQVSSLTVQGIAAKDDSSEASAETRWESRLVAATSTGRVVELRPHYGETQEFVPQRMVQGGNRDVAAPRGSLELLHGYSQEESSSIVARLRSERGTVHLGNDEDDTSVERRLPDGPQWLSICSEGKHLFALGARAGKPELWRFSSPSAAQLW